MCGIVGYIGKRAVVQLVLESLQALEYRGYDSSGIAFLDENHELSIYKAAGKLANLKSRLPESLFAKNGKQTHIAMGHTRWATHGPPTDTNAHPHKSAGGRIAVIHNGIIENFSEIRERLKAKGIAFQSDTDTECVVHLIEDIAETEPDFDKVLQLLAKQLDGTYALVVMNKDIPNKLYGIRHQAPLVIGVGHGELFIASDFAGVAPHTSKVAYLKDSQIVELSETGYRVFDFDGRPVSLTEEVLSADHLIVDKLGFKHFMLKEIYEQSDVVRNALSGRLHSSDTPVTLLSAEQLQAIQHAERVYIVACGTSYHAGLVGKYLIEELCQVPVDVETAGEFRYRNTLVNNKTVVIAISQSGETADTLMAIRQSIAKGATVITITNREDSTMARESQVVVPVRAGVEVSVCATKSFTAQLVALYLIGIQLAEVLKKPSATPERLHDLKQALLRVPPLIEKILADPHDIQNLAKKYGNAHNMIYIARGINYPVALEGALKLKEISYIHAEGYSGSELKHGPIALLDNQLPVVAVLTPGIAYEKMISNCQEARARDAQVLAFHCGPITTEKATTFTDVCLMPETDELLSPLISSIPLQLFSYYIAEYLGKDVDQPRNLAKSVTVE
jgi:glutamine---fructose-6-phosphate transaminase (isomerizing)